VLSTLAAVWEKRSPLGKLQAGLSRVRQGDVRSPTQPYRGNGPPPAFIEWLVGTMRQFFD